MANKADHGILVARDQDAVATVCGAPGQDRRARRDLFPIIDAPLPPIGKLLAAVGDPFPLVGESPLPQALCGRSVTLFGASGGCRLTIDLGLVALDPRAPA